MDSLLSNTFSLFSFDTAALSRNEQQYIITFINSIKLENICSFTNSFEDEICASKNLSDCEKDRLLQLTSLHKYSYLYCIYYASIYYPININSREDHFDACMRRELDAIFSNPVRAALFILNAPMSYWEVVAICLYDMATNYKPSA